MSISIVTLNVGGILYTTTQATLLKYPDSMLGSLISNDLPSTRDANGHYFIDRDGQVFRHVLNFLRSSQLCLPSDFKDLDLLATEADFYQISPLIDAINEFRDGSTKKSKTFYLEMIEVRTGSSSKMPSSSGKTILVGRKDILLSLPPSVIGLTSCNQHLYSKENEYFKFAEIELLFSPIRPRVGEELRNLGWNLISSDLSTSSGFNPKSYNGTMVIEHTFRERWSREFDADEPFKIHPEHYLKPEEANFEWLQV